MLDYQDCNFKTCGELLATSLAQGGPAPNFLTRWCYHFLCHGEILSDGGPDEVTAPDIKSLIERVENAEEEVLMDLSDAIMACGYRGPINIGTKEAITQAITLHAKVRLIPILNQLHEGLKLYGLDDFLKHHRQMCQQLFVPGHLNEVDSNFLLRALCPDFSEKGSVRRQREMKVINFLQDFLQNLEDMEEANSKEDEEINPGSCESRVPGTTGGGKRISVQSFFQWVTGQAHIPLIETEREAFKIMVAFDHDCDSHYGAHSLCYPIVNACAVGITFPVRHASTYSDFENNLTTAICHG
ncbi:G2/M phase-specific E3 ubiquitin-protein ligase-like [Melanotaenia boesemani]|uniref:G2/M phase-specific E3 ubiquitin-protein ligase-like n=1 Tax=Melanotaenia boesemani TaxID=1250792 RepID=UPI001C046852|nr:G2/M phase-specific E3 ubiquitin-protein ligase-like [Melanotaenia boesemani]